MKNITLAIIVMLLAGQFISCKNGEQSIVKNDGLVNFISGDVQIIADGKTLPLHVGDKITQGMIVKTGAGSIVDIHFQGSIIRINQDSSVVMKELVKNLKNNKESTELFVESGQVLSNVTKKLTDGEKFRVDTPTSVAAVRGTVFLVTAYEEKSTIACSEGKVAVKESSCDDSAFVMVEAGNEAVVEKGKPVVIRSLNGETGEKNKHGIKQTNKQDVVLKETKVKEKNKQAARQKDTTTEAIKGSSMIRAEVVKGDIEGKK